MMQECRERANINIFVDEMLFLNKKYLQRKYVFVVICSTHLLLIPSKRFDDENITIEKSSF